ncbi:MAG: hypothetical protein LBT53_00620 [Puniceicoccales bacterium]|nr:hypothetical protein [Puniceicoccales bacterium]
MKLDNSGADGRKRNDDTQAKSITVVCGYYLADYADSVRNDSSLSERLLVKEFANLFEIIGRVDFRAAAKKFGINLDDAMPQVGTEGLPKLQKFYAHKFTRSAAA